MFDGIHQITNEKWRKHNSIIKWPEGKIRWFRSLVLGSVDLLLCCVHFEVNLTWPHIAQKQAHCCSILILLNNNKVQWVFGSYKNALCFAAGLYEQPIRVLLLRLRSADEMIHQNRIKTVNVENPGWLGKKVWKGRTPSCFDMICEPENWEGA